MKKTGSRPIISPKILQERFEEELRRRLRAKMRRGDFGPESQKRCLKRDEERRLMDLFFERTRSTLH